MDKFYDDVSLFSASVVIKNITKNSYDFSKVATILNNIVSSYNNLWHEYHTDDSDVINKILNHKIILHDRCLFNYLFNHSKNLLEYLSCFINENSLE